MSHGEGAPASYRALTSVEQLETVDTAALFKARAQLPRSPIDDFIANTNTLNKIYLPYGPEGVARLPELGNLIVLGYMSAIESYVRAVVTALVNTDEISRRISGPRPVTFALATEHHDPRLLPEALMENMSFTTSGKIEEALRVFVGISKLSSDVEKALVEFKKLCHVRHCCVHRFGKLGSANAMDLGFERHRKAIEHPFSPTLDDLERIADALQILVRTLNNFVFREILDRTVREHFNGQLSWCWTWHYGRDKKRFTSYYDLFAIKEAHPISAPPKDVYATFRAEFAAMVKQRARRENEGR